MEQQSYTKEVVDLKIESIHDRFNGQDKVLAEILKQTTKTNGRVTVIEGQITDTATKKDLSKINRILLIVGCVTGTLLVTNGSQLIHFIMSIL